MIIVTITWWQRSLSTHYSKSQIFVQKFNFDKPPTFSRVFRPIFFWQFFSWNQSCQQLKSRKPQHFHEFFTPKKSGNQSWIFGQKMKISNSVEMRLFTAPIKFQFWAFLSSNAIFFFVVWLNASFKRKLEIFSSHGVAQFELPGVSTTVSVKLTPFSLRRTFWVSIATVFLSRCEGPGYSLEYMSVKNIELINVDLPSPDSPTTIKVNSKPFLTAFRYTWLGKLAKPT